MRKKGFTLIELLAVIVILALIALIAVPLILNVIEESKRGAAKESATNYVKQVENALVVSLMDGSSVITQGLYTLDSNGNIESPVTLEVPMKGDKAKAGSVCIGEKGAVTAYSLKVGSYYVTSSDGTNQEITDSVVELDCKMGATYQVYANGTVVYYNPTTGKKCDDYEEANSNTGVKSGCMKWYTFLDSEENDKVKLLLDHNTTATVNAWKSSGSNAEGIEKVKTALAEDTRNWKSEETPRLITAQEIADISGNTTWKEANRKFYFGSADMNDDSLKSNYGWLYDRTFTNCIIDGCFHNSDVITFGYWTDTLYIDSSSEAWEVEYRGYLNHRADDATYGVRPVITVTKHTIS